MDVETGVWICSDTGEDKVMSGQVSGRVSATILAIPKLEEDNIPSSGADPVFGLLALQP